MGQSAPEPHPLSQLYGSLEAAAGIGTWRYHFKARQLTWSRGIYDLLGLPADSAPSYDLFAKFTHPDDRLPVDNLESYLKEVRTIDREFRIIDSRGLTRWVSHKAEVFIDEAGERIAAAGILIDISSRMNAIHDREAANKRLRALSELIATATWTTEPDGTKTTSQGWMDLTGQSAQESGGLGWLNAVYEADREATKEAWLKASCTNTRFMAKYRLKCKDGQLRWILVQGVPVFDQNRVFNGWLGAMIDIDDLERRPVSISYLSDFSGLTGSLITAARALAGWSLLDLATASGVSISTIRRVEELENIAAKKDVVLKLISSLQEAGVEFGQEDEGWCVRVRK
jgi:PAS domain S-box-containing protein